MFQFPKIRELSFLVYGLSLTGRSVIKFLKIMKLKILKFGMITKKRYLIIIEQRI